MLQINCVVIFPTDPIPVVTTPALGTDVQIRYSGISGGTSEVFVLAALGMVALREYERHSKASTPGSLLSELLSNRLST
jgi:hypothetical protein